MKKTLALMIAGLSVLSFSLADNCDTITSRTADIRQRMYSIEITMNDLEIKMETQPAYRARYLKQYQDEKVKYDKLYSETLALTAEAERCIHQENIYREQASNLLNVAFDYYQSKEYKKSLEKYRELASVLEKISDVEDVKYEVKSQIRELEQIVDAEEWFYKLYDMEKRAYDYLQNKEIDRAYNLYKEVVSYEGKHEYDYTTAKKALKDLEEIKKIQAEMDVAEKAHKEAEAKAQAEAEAKAEMEQINRAKEYLGKKAAIIESLSRNKKLQDKDLRDKFITVYKGYKTHKNQYYKAFGIYFVYLLENN